MYSSQLKRYEGIVVTRKKRTLSIMFPLNTSKRFKEWEYSFQKYINKGEIISQDFGFNFLDITSLSECKDEETICYDSILKKPKSLVSFFNNNSTNI